jgi:hypothetical protein
VTVACCRLAPCADHDVATTITTNNGPDQLQERALAVHEHLSPIPEASAT